MKTAFVSNDIFVKHDTGPGHPETAARYSAVVGAVKDDANLWNELQKIDSKPASKGLIKAAHSSEHFKRVETAFESGIEALDNDTMISMRSFEAALCAAGAVCDAVDAVIAGDAPNAFAAVRPPGHHATAENAMGFCLFNNVAVGAKYAQNKFKDVGKVAIFDWDVHHGNGTQGIFYDDPSVFFMSMHQYPWYPGTGARGETGYGRGRGTTLNVPVKAYTPRDVNVRLFEAAIEDIEFDPDLVIISSGFDGHASDPLGQLLFEDEDFAAMTRVVKQWASEKCSGRVVSVLEGGYNLDTLGGTAVAHVRALAESD
ncbi:MAG: histone deacetylase [Pyrinomonadaceae bacterium]|nr:histone deacetylase [Pyrinomonadaceae bacterium]